MITDLLSRPIDQPQNEQCVLNGYEEYKFTEKGAAYTVASVTQSGRVAKIKIYQGNGQRLTPDKIGQVLNFNLKSYQARNNNIYISGFWNDQAQTAPQNAPQSTNYPQPTAGVEDKITQIAERLVTSIEILIDKKLSDRFAEKYGLNEPEQPASPDDEEFIPV